MKKVLILVIILSVFLTLQVSFAQDSIEIPTPPPEIDDIIEEVQTIYRITIHYIYEDGTTAAPDYTAQLAAGTRYDVDSPIIPGYTASEDNINGTMPARDLEFTVIYIGGHAYLYSDFPEGGGDPQIVMIYTIEDYETSLGLGPSNMNVGITIE